MALTSSAPRIRSGGLSVGGGAGGAPTSDTTSFLGEGTKSWARSTGYSPRHRCNRMWERSTRELLPRVTPAVTRKLRHPTGHDVAGCATGKFPRTAKRLSVTRPVRCPVADDPTGRDGERAADATPECEPDYRFTLANERTFLAWQRTALGLLAAAVAVVQLVPQLTIPGARHALGVLLAVLATLARAMGLLRWQKGERSIRRGPPLPRHPTPAYLAVGLTVIGILAIGLVIGR